MVNNPIKWIKKHGKKVDIILLHIESFSNKSEIYQAIEIVRKMNKKVGLCINPETPAKKLVPFLNIIDQVLFMTVHPGRYGAKFLPTTLKKVKEIRSINPYIDLEVDGGITSKTIGIAMRAGANKFVSGSYLIKSKSIKKAINTLRLIVNKN
jgi:ribulose-phosphate 3-epimerase